MPSTLSGITNPILQQVTYYFSDYNLPKDGFLKKQMNNQGWVTLECLVGFNRLKALTTSPKKIVEAIRDKSNFLEISKDNAKIRRNPEKKLPDKKLFFETLKERTAYVTGFPTDENLDNIIEFMHRENYGPVESYRRWTESKETPKSKSSFYFVFRDVPSCKAFVEAQGITYKGETLERKFQLQFYAEKKEAKAKAREDKEKKLQDDNKTKREEKAGMIKKKLPKKASMAFSSIPADAFLSRVTFKEKLKKIDDQLSLRYYLKFKKGAEKEGFIRFRTENTAERVIQGLSNCQLDIGVARINFRVLQGDEEDAFLEKAAFAVVDKRRKRNKKRRTKAKDEKKKCAKESRGIKRKQRDDSAEKESVKQLQKSVEDVVMTDD